MRIASKNELIVLLGDKAFNFATFCLSPLGASFKFLFDNTTSFDLDLDFIQGSVQQLLAAGVIDEATVGRIASFTPADIAPTLPPTVTFTRTFIVPVPEGQDPIEWGTSYLTTPGNIHIEGSNIIVITDGDYTAPNAMELT